jgi:hypothetical protein
MNGEKRAEIYTHRFDDYVYAMNWSVGDMTALCRSAAVGSTRAVMT